MFAHAVLFSVACGGAIIWAHVGSYPMVLLCGMGALYFWDGVVKGVNHGD